MRKYILIIVLILGIVAVLYFKGDKKEISNFFGLDANSLTGAYEVGNEIYTDNVYGFSISLSKDMTASSFAEAGGDTVLLKDTSYQLQIHITSFDEDIVLTAERIKKDIPDIQMENPTTVSIDGTSGVAFVSGNDGEKYLEVWFVHGGYLYQTLSLSNQDSQTFGLLQNWKWL